ELVRASCRCLPLPFQNTKAFPSIREYSRSVKCMRKLDLRLCTRVNTGKRQSDKWHIVHDFRGLNAKVRVPANPIPRKDEIFRRMGRGRLFGAMDLLWGFYQVKLQEDSIPYTAFATPDGLFEYLVTPMRIASSPAAFNWLVQSIFADYSSFCQTYFDDMFVFTESDSFIEHLAAVERVLERCEQEQLFVKIEKCQFCKTKIPCIDDLFGRDGVRMDPPKSRVIRDWPLPKPKCNLQSFLGTCVYVLRFCEGFAKLTAPLTELTKRKRPNNPVVFTKTATSAFASLKKKLVAPPTLAHPDFSQQFHVKADAFDFAVGCYLFQLDSSGVERVIAYGGRKLTRAELSYPTREKQLLAALVAMRTWKVYLIDSQFYISTDHRTIESLLQQQTCSQRLAWWLTELALFQPLFKWIHGSDNTAADALSRRSD
ncbi:hypothetical protein PybrP1_008128, partial [[Pythium] brassicae (nom. inval.)]